MQKKKQVKIIGSSTLSFKQQQNLQMQHLLKEENKMLVSNKPADDSKDVSQDPATSLFRGLKSSLGPLKNGSVSNNQGAYVSIIKSSGKGHADLSTKLIDSTSSPAETTLLSSQTV